MSYNISKSNKSSIGLGTYLYTTVTSEVWWRVFDALARAEHGPVPSNHSASGGLASAAAPSTPPPSHLPDNSQRAPDKLVRVSRCSVHCTALTAGKTTTEQRGTRKKKRKGSVGLSLRQLSTFSLSLSSYISDFCLGPQKKSLRLIQRSLSESCSEINQGLSSTF